MSLQQLSTLAKQKDEIGTLLKADRYKKIGLQEDLKEIYKPILESNKNIEQGAEKNAEKIINKIEETKTSSQNKFNNLNTSINQIADLILKFPNILDGLRGEDVFYTPEEEEVMKDIERLTPRSKEKLFKKIENINNERLKVEKMEDLEIKKMLKSFKEDDKEEIGKIINDADKLNKLVSHAVNSDITDFSKSKYAPIEKYVKGFTRMVQDNRIFNEFTPKKKKGKGIVRFLPSSTDELVNHMNRLLGSFKAGNKNAFNEISAISDILRRRGILKTKTLKQLYRHLK